jgi:UDP-galactopyranose mutase
MTRCCEYKLMTLQKSSWTTVSKEFPGKYLNTSKKYIEPFYPLNDKVNLNLYKAYVELKNKYRNIQLLGRMAQYKYFDMDDAILNAFKYININ